MTRYLHATLIALLLLVAVPAAGVSAQAEIPPIPDNCMVVPPPPEATGVPQYLLCMPATPAPIGDLVIYAHGYVSPTLPVGLLSAYDQFFLPDGTSIPGVITSLGYYFAAPSYPKNGLAVLPGINDVLVTIDLFKMKYAELSGGLPFTGKVYIIGASEGGLVTTLAVEQRPDVFAGGMAICAPNGDFRKQINYWGNFRVLFDYFFPGVMPGDAVTMPNPTDADWATIAPNILLNIGSNLSNTSQLLRVSKAPIDLADPQVSTAATVQGILWYSYFATEDGQITLGGQPFDNRHKLYTGSSNDRLLNRLVDRFNASPAAVKTINAYYQASGDLHVPLVTMHTTGDPIVPVWHQALYTLKVAAQHKLRKLAPMTITRYGHCNFTQTEAVAGFYMMVLKAGGTLPPLPVLQAQATDRQEFKDLTGRDLK